MLTKSHTNPAGIQGSVKVPGESSTREAFCAGWALPSQRHLHVEISQSTLWPQRQGWRGTAPQGRGLLPPGTCERKRDLEKELKVPQKLLARVNYSFL